jgi:Tat protein secretion system quality control protein TatD with DNase activity
VLAPQAWRGRRNEPAFVTAVRDAVGAARGVDPRAVEERTWTTAAEVFGWGMA